jgi:transglutaminase-like putative cysteine protease
VPDVTDSVVLYPRGNLNTYVGAPENERIRFRAEALRSDGTVRRNVTGFTYSGSGVNSSTGVLTPVSAGTATVSVSIGGRTASRDVTVHPANYKRLPYTYPGTGLTYNGFTGGTEGSTTVTGGLTVTYPAETRFSADGFFTLEGTVNNSAVHNYAYVRVTKNNTLDTLTTYFVKDNFKQRIWLRFGQGDYTVTVHGLSSITINSEGHISGISWHSGITYNVTNTRNDGRSVDGSTPDRRFIYPSYIIQSDDFRITNLASDLTYGLTDNVAKIKAIHDYIVAHTVYDRMSYEIPAMHKNQDALTVLGTRYFFDSQYINGHFLAVCEGYSNTFAALARAAGFEVKYISSNPMNHAWNNIFVNGGWKFVDVTWNDPSVVGASSTNIVDGGPSSVRYDYFLLDNLRGVNNSHFDGTQDNSRSVIPAVPRRHGTLEGWY